MITSYRRHKVVMQLTDTDTFNGSVLNEIPKILQCDVVFYIPSKLNQKKK